MQVMRTPFNEPPKLYSPLPDICLHISFTLCTNDSAYIALLRLFLTKKHVVFSISISCKKSDMTTNVLGNSYMQ